MTTPANVIKKEIAKLAADEKLPRDGSLLESEIDEVVSIINDTEVAASALNASEQSTHKDSFVAEEVLISEGSKADDISDQLVVLQNLPTESDAALLWREVEQNQFYASTERADVSKQYETFLLSLASGKDSVEIKKEYDALEQQVSKLMAGPSPEVLLDRSKRIVTRIIIGTEPGSFTQTKALSLWDSLKNRVSESGSAKRLSLYRELESHAKHSESEWLTICGQQLPVSGVSGVPTASSLKEGLEQALEHHPVLLDSPKKHVLVNQLIRLLSSVSDSGLSARDVSEARQLVRLIDVPAAHTNADKIVSSVESPKHEVALQIDPSVSSVAINKTESDESHVLSEAELEEMKALEMMEEDNFFARPRQKTMSIQSGDDDGDVVISVSEEIAASLNKYPFPAEQQPEIDIVTEQPLSQATAVNSVATHQPEIAAILEKTDPVNKSVHHILPRPMRAAPELSPDSLTARFLQAEPCQRFIAAHYHSQETFEKLLDSTITSIEAENVDRFERWLGESYNSAFAFISDMTVGEVLEFAVDRGVRSVLKEKNIKYETFVAWIDSIGDMQIVAGEDLNFLFGELFALWFIRIKMLDAGQA